MDKLNYVKCIVSYDGSKFNGWQIQNDFRSVQEEIQLALFKMHKHEVSITGAGRTDKGVHALGQTFNFASELNLTLYEWKKALNHYLPDDIHIKEVEFVDENFHSRFSSKSKKYVYYLNTNEFDPIKKDYIYQYNRELDIKQMQEDAKLFVGHHDYMNFCANSIEEVKSFEKDIHSFDIKEEDGIISFEVIGSGFLRYQIRMMVGALIAIGSHKQTNSIILERLDKKEANTIMYNAPSVGLYLVEIIY